MAEGEPTNQKPPANTDLTSIEDVAAAIEKTKSKSIKNPAVKLPANFLKIIEEIGVTLKDIKLVNANLEKTLSNLEKSTSNLQNFITSKNAKPELVSNNSLRPKTSILTETADSVKSFFKKFNLPGIKSTETNIQTNQARSEEDTGAAVLKKEEPKPVIITNFDDQALKTQHEFYKKEPLPIKLIEIEDKLLSKIEKLFEKLGKGKGDSGAGAFFKTVIGAVKSLGPALSSLGTGLGKGFERLGKGIGGGIAAIGEGFGAFLSGFGVGLKPLAAGLQALANPKVAIGLGLVILAINGIALALRIAEPAIKAIIPLFEKIAEVIGGVFMKAIETVGEVLKSFVKEIPNMIRAVGDAIATILERAGPAFLELARIIGDVVIKVLKEVSPIVAALIPAFVALVKTIKEGVIGALTLLSPIVTKIIDTLGLFAGIIEKVLITAIEALVPILKGIIPFLETVVNSVANFANKFLGTFDNIVNKLTEIIVVGMEKTEGIVKSIGSTILGIIEKTGVAVTSILTTVTNSISRLADIGGLKLTAVAGGIAAIAASIGLFGAGSAAAGIGKFFGDVASKATGSKTPFEQILALAEQATNIKTVAGTITDLANALIGFSKIKISEINFGGLIISFNNAVKDVDKNGVEVFANIAAGMEKLTIGQEFIDSTADSVDKLAEAFLKFNNLDIDKLKEITQLPLKKMAKIATVATVATTLATATPQSDISDQSTAPVTVEATPNTTEEDFQSTTPTETDIESSKNQSQQTNLIEKEQPSLFSNIALAPEPTVQGEFNVNTAPVLPMEAAAPSTPELSIIAQKLEKLIQTLQPLLEQRKDSAKIADNSSISSINTATVGGTNTTTIYTNSVDRDIPFLERNKYREQYLYSRGLI